MREEEIGELSAQQRRFIAVVEFAPKSPNLTEPPEFQSARALLWRSAHSATNEIHLFLNHFARGSIL